MSETRLAPPLRVFLSYSHRDEEMCERFLVHLSQLKRESLVEAWHDRRITAGTDWGGAIDEHLNSAHLIILLVSADFLDSDYCNDVEMARALERHQSGEARVVPVILKPCDWETSRFHSLQALPKGGRPVVDWPTPEHGFLDAVKGLRKVITEQTGPVSLPAKMQVNQTDTRRHAWRWARGLTIAGVLLVGWWLWSNSQRYLNQGTTLLNVGRYAEARPALEQAKKWNPLSRPARCGLEAIRLEALRSDRSFKEFLDEANRQYPNCAYLKLLSGDQKYLAGDRDGALAEYREAVKLAPQLAEAQFDVGRILDLKRLPDEALEPYKKAAELSPGTPAYHNNLGDLYFRRKDYDDAIKEYANVAEFPLSALEVAKIYRLQNELDVAAEREVDAIRWLQRPSAELVEQGHAWGIDVNVDEQRRLGPIVEKQCYADLELAVTRFLQGDESAAREKVPATIGGSGKCYSRRTDLTDILKWELRQLGSELPQFTKRSDEFAAKFLGPSIH